MEPDRQDGVSRRQTSVSALARRLAVAPRELFDEWRAAERSDLDDRLRAASVAHGTLGELDALRVRVAHIAALRFLDELENRPLGAEAPQTIESFVPPYLADLHLAIACSSSPRDDAAWRTLLRLHGTPLVKLARSVDPSNADSEVHDFFGDLWVPRARGEGMLATYRGLAPLASWLKLVLRRRLALRQRKTLRASWIIAAARPDPVDPQDSVATEEVGGVLSTTLHRLLDSLPERDRDFVVATVLRHETGVATARRHGVSPAYVSKRSREVLAMLRRRLAPVVERLGLDPEVLA